MILKSLLLISAFEGHYSNKNNFAKILLKINLGQVLETGETIKNIRKLDKR